MISKKQQISDIKQLKDPPQIPLLPFFLSCRHFSALSLLLQTNTLLLPPLTSPAFPSSSTLLHLGGICHEEASICSLRGILCPPLCRSVPEVRQSHGGSMAMFSLARKWDMDPGGKLCLIFILVSVSRCEYLGRFLCGRALISESD